jgi:uncharacterized protein DUF6152
MKPRTQITAVMLAAGTLLLAASAQAHHSIANFWDQSKNISVSGIVKEVKLVNPHSELTLEVMEDGKPVKWLAFGLGITDLRRRGITNEMLMGKHVTFEGHPPKKAAGKGIFLSGIVFDDGKRIDIAERGGGREGGGAQ